MTLKKIRRVVLALIVLVLVFGAGWQLGQRQPNNAISNNHSQLKFTDSPLFNQVYGLLENSFLEKEKLSDQDQLLYGSIEGMVSSLGDPYTVFLAPDENKKFKEDMAGSFGGVGIELGYKDKQLAVVAPLEDTPADEAGVQAGDYIAHIKDEKKDVNIDAGEISLLEAVEIIRGPIGNPVELTLLRSGEKEPLKVQIVRQKITIPRVTLEIIEKDGEKIAHLKLARFGDNTIEQWDEQIEKINTLKSSPQFSGIILDLRNNPGGYLNGAIYIASEFISSGVIVKQESRQQPTQSFKVKRQGNLLNTPLVVLVNQGSASASEIVAGALREQKNVSIVGQTTFGKGTIQQSEELNNDASLHVTIARWLLPSGKGIHEVGIKPDVEIKNDYSTAKDEQLEKAIEQLVS